MTYRTAIDTSNLPTLFAAPPLLKTLLMKVLSASSFAPDKLFAFLHIKDADWTFAVDWLTLPNMHSTVVHVVMLQDVNFIFPVYRGQSKPEDWTRRWGNEMKDLHQALPHA